MFCLQVKVPQELRGEPEWQTIATFGSAQARQEHADKYPRTLYRHVRQVKRDGKMVEIEG